jgi:hypothetical protein
MQINVLRCATIFIFIPSAVALFIVPARDWDAVISPEDARGKTL